MATEYKVAKWQLAQRQSLDLDMKIIMTKRRIRIWHEHWNGHVHVSFSGGLDSTVLLHLVREEYPNTPAVFIDTGLEYPEIREHVKATPNVTWIRPKMSFMQVIKKHGYPIVSKQVSQQIREARTTASPILRKLRRTGIRSDGTYCATSKIPDKWLFLIHAPFKISERCCDELKKKPAHQAEKEFGWPYLGTRAEESEQRKLIYRRYGCNSFDMNRPRSTPLAFWLQQDIPKYIRKFNIPYSSIYDKGYIGTGCVFCAFGAHLSSPNRFQLLKKIHPKLWTYCMDKLGMGEVLKYCGIKTTPSRMEPLLIPEHQRSIVKGGL